MDQERITLRREGDGRYQCGREGLVDLHLKFASNDRIPEKELNLLSSFLVQGARYDADGLVLERKHLSDQDVPVLLCYPEGARKLPLIFFSHGFTGYKELDIGFGVQLAKAGYFVVLADARCHGERKPDNFDAHFDERFFNKFLAVIRDTTTDLIGLIDHFEGDERVNNENVGIAGVSMGGFISFLAATMDSRIKVAAPLIASPFWGTMNQDQAREFESELDEPTKRLIEEWEPLGHSERFFPKALLMQNGLDDSVIPIKGARALYQKLQEGYRQSPGRLQMIEYPGVGHIVTDEMSRVMVEWFTRFL